MSHYDDAYEYDHTLAKVGDERHLIQKVRNNDFSVFCKVSQLNQSKTVTIPLSDFEKMLIIINTIDPRKYKENLK